MNGNWCKGCCRRKPGAWSGPRPVRNRNDVYFLIIGKHTVRDDL